MARAVQQIQADLDALNAARARPESAAGRGPKGFESLPNRQPAQHPIGTQRQG